MRWAMKSSDPSVIGTCLFLCLLDDKLYEQKPKGSKHARSYLKMSLLANESKFVARTTLGLAFFAADRIRGVQN